MAAKDDLLDDLAEHMGADFGFGYDDDLGDPNVAPKVPPAPRQTEDKLTDTSMTLVFPRQQQYLTKLLVQVTPATSKNAAAPFANFSPGAAESRQVEAEGDAKTCNEVTVAALQPGTKYYARLVVTNPSGTKAGAVTEVLLTKPSVPPAPVCTSAGENTANLAFDAIGQNLTELTLEVVRYDEDSDTPFEVGKPFTVKVGKPETASGTAVNGLLLGKRYVARLRATNAAGEATGAASEPFTTLPDMPALGEDHRHRTHTSVMLKFEAVASFVEELEVQVLESSGRLDWGKARTVKVEEPQTARTVTVADLEPSKEFAFRLRARNQAGEGVSDILRIETVDFAPELLDKSGWLLEMPRMEGRKTLGRRLSIRKTKPKKYWYVLDGKLLTWFTEVDGEEVGFMHLGKIAEIRGDEYSGDTTMLELVDKSNTAIMLMADSSDPNVSSNEVCVSWIKALKAAWRPSKPAAAAEPEKATAAPAEEAPAPAAEPEPAAAPAADGGGDDEEEEFGF